MLALLLAAATLATPSPPMPAITVVDAECTPTSTISATDRLEATHVVSWQSCAPGGPCSHIGTEDQGMSEVVLRKEDEVVSGSWKKTARSCGEASVWRWSKPLKPGEYTLIRGQGFGYAEVYVYPDALLGAPRVEEQHSEQRHLLPPEETQFFLQQGFVRGYGSNIGLGAERIVGTQSWTRRTTYTEVGDGLACIIEHVDTTVLAVPSLERESTLPQTTLREGRPGPCPSPAEAE